MKPEERKSRWKQFVNVEIFSKWEIVAFIGLFLVLSFVLFPKGKISEILLTQEDYNLDLSRIYLEKLLDIKFDPKLFSLLIEKDIRLGRYDEARELIKKYMKKIKNKKLRKKLYLLEYKVLVSEYFAEKEKRKEVRGELRKLLEDYMKEFPSADVYEFVYKQAVAFGFRKLALTSCEKLARITGRKRYYKQLLVLAMSLGDKALISDTLKRLAEIEGTSKNFDRELFKTALYLRQKRVVERLARSLLEEGKLSYRDFDSFINFELSYKDYGEALGFCKAYMRRTSSLRVLKKCISLALWSKDYDSVSRLIEYGLKKYRNDEEALEYFLKVARASNDRKLALKIADLLFRKISRKK